MEYKAFTYTPIPKTAWDNLSMLEKSEMMRVAVRNGITDLKTIREKYNEFAKGGYLDWKEKASKYKHLDIDNDRTYDYEGWYNENPQRAWDFLNDSPDAHFDDKYKTVYHPTFSTQSKYSGKKDATYNPLGLTGGTWNKQGTVFTMSPDGYRGPVSMDDRKWYLENAEDNGVQLREADGSLPIYDGIPWGGVLPNVTITGNKFAEGGNIYSGDEEETQQMEVSKSPHVDLAISNPWLYQKLHPAQRKAEKYEPTTFVGKITQLAGASELGQKYADYTSSVIQQVPVVGLVPSALDLGYDTNRLYHNPSLTTTKDVILDAASLVPALRKTMKGWWMKGNSGPFITETGQIINNPRVASTLEVALQPFRTAINTIVYGARAADFLDDSKAYLKEMYNSSKIGKHFPIKALGGPLVEAAMNEYKKGGSIHIAPSKKGTFTAAAKKHGKSVQAFASQVLAHPENYSPAMRKKANFARNARKWKHGLGGNLFLTGGPEKKGREEVTNLSIWDELAAQSPLFYTIGKAIDPTGISGYEDAREAINQYDSSPSLSNGYAAVMETLGALPIVSKAGKAIKFLQRAVTGQGVFDDYNYAQEKKKEYGDELVVDYWDNTVKPRREAERHGEQMKSKMAYTDVHHVPSFKLAPKGSKSGQVISDYDINHRVVKKYKKAFGGNLFEDRG